MNINLHVPDEVVAALRVPPDCLEDEVKREVALSFYSRNLLSAGKASELAGMSRLDFEQLLCSRKVVRNYSMEDLEHDLTVAEESTERLT